MTVAYQIELQSQQGIRLRVCLSFHHAHIGYLHWVMTTVGGGAAAVPPPPTIPQHKISVTVRILHQPNSSCSKTIMYCLTGQENTLL